MKNNEHTGHRGRLRERVRREGLDNFYNYQVLEYVLSFVVPYKDTNPMAHKLINKFGSVSAVFEADEDKLMEVDGLGEVTAHFLANFIKIYDYYAKEKINKDIVLLKPDQTAEFAFGLLKGSLVEEFHVVLINSKNKIIKTEKLASGTNIDVDVNIRQIMNSVIKNKAHNVIVAHNHPKGDSKPSKHDDKFTKALVTTLAINNCNLMDHIIISSNDYYSYRESAVLDKYKDEIAYLVNDYIVENKEIENDTKGEESQVKKFKSVDLEYFYNIKLDGTEEFDDKEW